MNADWPWPWPKPDSPQRCRVCDFHPVTEGHRDGCAEASREAGHDAYRRGMCKWCHHTRHRPGSPECESCWRWRTGRAS